MIPIVSIRTVANTGPASDIKIRLGLNADFTLRL